jgi:hypothetical protein
MHPEHRSVGELAYQLWQARGCPDGTAEQDWLDAERQLRAGRQTSTSEATDASLKDTFPASDPPATHGTGEPASNAGAKWKAAGISRKGSNRRSAPAPSG